MALQHRHGNIIYQHMVNIWELDLFYREVSGILLLAKKKKGTSPCNIYQGNIKVLLVGIKIKCFIHDHCKESCYFEWTSKQTWYFNIHYFIFVMCLPYYLNLLEVKFWIVLFLNPYACKTEKGLEGIKYLGFIR